LCIPKLLEREWGDCVNEYEYEYELIGTRSATPRARQQLRKAPVPSPVFFAFFAASRETFSGNVLRDRLGKSEGDGTRVGLALSGRGKV